MIKLTRLNGKEFVLNCDLIEFIESTPDTVISTTTGKKIVVAEPVDSIVDKIVEFRRRLSFIEALK